MLKKESGFTLIELMIVVAIVGILASVAIASYNSYRQKAFKAVLLQDVRNAGTMEEAIYATTQSYVAFGPVTAGSATISVVISPGMPIKISPNVTLQGTLNAGAVTISGSHPGATQAISYSSTVGAIN